MKVVWMALAAGCIVTAAVFVWQRDFNIAFVVAAIGLVAWFLNYRIQMKQVTADADAKREREVKEVDENP